MPAWIDITGKSFGNWTAIRYVGREVWECRCGLCQRVFLRNGAGLKTQKHGNCIHCARSIIKAKHGHTRNKTPSRAYEIWHGMTQRCRNKKNAGYKHYGGRGIKICDRWKDFRLFYRDMGEPPAGLTLDRVNNDGHYEPGNCRWATKVEQGNNRSTSRFVIFKGERMSHAQASRAMGYTNNAVNNAINRAHMRAGTVPFLMLRRPHAKLKKGLVVIFG